MTHKKCSKTLLMPRLRRAVALAGAHTLVMNLWKVHDRQTQGLMEDFYERILVGGARSEALRYA